MNEIEQIYYRNWSDELQPGHESYWQDVGAVARLLALMLEEMGIPVAQYKEKFGQARVYLKRPLGEGEISHYTGVYATMRRLVPHYWAAMVSGADFPEHLDGFELYWAQPFRKVTK